MSVEGVALPPARGPPACALVVGGTGMLSGVSPELATQGYQVGVIARSEGRLEELRRRAEALSARVIPLPLDYHDARALRAGLERLEGECGPPSLQVTWVHRSAPGAVPLIVDWRKARGGRWRWIEVLGSASADPPSPREKADLLPLARSSLVRHQKVVLGFVLGHGASRSGSRWLTDEEISRGVLDAIDSGAERSIVGQVEPWSLRPGGP